MAMSLQPASTSSRAGSTGAARSGRAPGHSGPAPPPGAARPAHGGARAVVAQLTGLSNEQVADQIAGGASLATIAERAGVARADLVSTLARHAPKALRATERAEEIINRIVDEAGEIDRPGGTEAAVAAVRPMVIGVAQRPRGHRNATGLLTDIATAEQREVLGGIAELLGTDPDALAAELRSGADVASMLAAAGVDRGVFAGAVGRGVLFDGTA